MSRKDTFTAKDMDESRYVNYPGLLRRYSGEKLLHQILVSSPKGIRILEDDSDLPRI